MSRSKQNPRQAEHLLAVFAGLTAAGLVYAFLRGSALYLMAASIPLLAWLFWRRRTSPAGTTLLLGAAAFTLSLALVLARPHLNIG